MFEVVSIPRGSRRSPEAVALTVLLNVGVGAGLMWLFGPAQPVAEAREVEPAERYVELRLPAPAGGSAPATPAPRRRTEAPSRPAPSVPEAVVSPVVEPTVVAAPAVVAPDGGGGGGGGTGVGPGDDPGPGTGEGDGACVGEGCGDRGPRVVHWSEVVPTHRVRPRFPDAALAAGVKEGTCVVRIDMDGKGVPLAVAPVECPEAFVRSAVDAAMGWRFEPLDDGASARFDLRIEYRSR